MDTQKLHSIGKKEILQIDLDIRYFIKNRRNYDLTKAINKAILLKRWILDVLKTYPNTKNNYLKVNKVISKSIYLYYLKEKPEIKDLPESFNISKTIA